MCTSNKCLFCIPVEVGALIFGVISSIISLICTIVVGILMIYANLIMEKTVKQVVNRWEYKSRGFVNGIMVDSGIAERDPERDISYAIEDATFLGSVTFNLVAGFGLLLLFMAFVFSVVLCDGICKRKPSKVRAYFIYGVVVAVLSLLAGLIAIVCEDVSAGVITLIATSIYSLKLVMVHLTYRKFNSGMIYNNDHKRLVETVNLEP